MDVLGCFEWNNNWKKLSYRENIYFGSKFKGFQSMIMSSHGFFQSVVGQDTISSVMEKVCSHSWQTGSKENVEKVRFPVHLSRAHSSVT